jgi:hypothetical protein
MLSPSKPGPIHLRRDIRRCFSSILHCVLRNKHGRYVLYRRSPEYGRVPGLPHDLNPDPEHHGAIVVGYNTMYSRSMYTTHRGPRCVYYTSCNFLASIRLGIGMRIDISYWRSELFQSHGRVFIVFMKNETWDCTLSGWYGRSGASWSCL